MKSREIAPPEGFSFEWTAFSHGWAFLEPFGLDRQTWTLHYGPLEMRPATDSSAVELSLVNGVDIGTDEADSARHMLRFDDDLDDFYAVCAQTDLSWVPRVGAGRLLRSPTVFEDLIKTVCTTNCSWALTRTMVANLVSRLGRGAFPSPAAIAGAGTDVIEDMSFGYRTGAVVRIAELVASSALDPQRWLDPAVSNDFVREEILALPGCGPYVADNLARLCGRYEGLALDAAVRRKLRRIHGDSLDDRDIEKRFAPFGRWRGLAIWCEFTEDWPERESMPDVSPETRRS